MYNNTLNPNYYAQFSLNKATDLPKDLIVVIFKSSECDFIEKWHFLQ